MKPAPEALGTESHFEGDVRCLSCPKNRKPLTSLRQLSLHLSIQARSCPELPQHDF
jgi:hypothetical protein